MRCTHGVELTRLEAMIIAQLPDELYKSRADHDGCIMAEHGDLIKRTAYAIHQAIPDPTPKDVRAWCRYMI